MLLFQVSSAFFSLNDFSQIFIQLFFSIFLKTVKALIEFTPYPFDTYILNFLYFLISANFGGLCCTPPNLTKLHVFSVRSARMTFFIHRFS